VTQTASQSASLSAEMNKSRLYMELDINLTPTARYALQCYSVTGLHISSS